MIYSYFVRGEHHAALARTSMESVVLADPDAYIVVVTDEYQPSWVLPAKLIHIPEGMPIMLANLEAQVAVHFRLPPWPEVDIAFLDTDTLIRRPLDDGLRGGHIAVTWRDHVRVIDDEKVEGIAGVMPYNYGVILSKGRCQPATEAFIWMRERVRKMHERHQQWYGNQLALAALCGPPPVSGDRIDSRQIPWHLTRPGINLNVRKLPCEVWNYTPQKAGEDVSERVLLHFKGGSRPLMEGYAREMGLGWYL